VAAAATGMRPPQWWRWRRRGGGVEGSHRCFSRADQRARRSRCGAQHATFFGAHVPFPLCSAVSGFRDQAAMDSSVSPTVAVGRVAAEIRTTIVLALLRLAFQGAMERVSPPATKTHAERFLKGAHPLMNCFGKATSAWEEVRRTKRSGGWSHG